jgi:two-component system, sensor histidine kinase and response regulator
VALNTRTNGPERQPLPSTLLHDLRTPLNQIIGYSELLYDQAQDSGYGTLLPDLQKLCNAGQNLLSFINGNFYSSTSGTVGPPPAVVQHDALVESLREEPVRSSSKVAVQGYILVVDDDESNRDVLSRRLEAQGYAVDTAENGERALEMLRDDMFDLVLLDLLMPGTNGFEVLQRIKIDEAVKHIPVIMISALDELDSVARCIEMGAEDYLAKPFNPTILKARIGACLEKKHARDREQALYGQLQKNFTRLQELERLRDDLTRMIIHDLRTPLTSLIAGMQTMDSIGELNVEQNEMKEIAIHGGEELLGMINDLLDVEKLEAGSMQLDYAILTSGDLVDSAVTQLSALADAKSVKLVREVQANLAPFHGDEGKLRRALVNLMGNAIKFSSEGGTVTIHAGSASDGASVKFSVTDEGEGVPAEAFERIFEKFGQVDSHGSGRVQGTGLGLTFCKLAVEAHGGQIGLESELGKGSCFYFSVPVKSQHAPLAPIGLVL